MKKFIKDNDILRLPDPDRCKVEEMPEFMRGNSTAYLNPAPPLDAKATSYYAISPPPRHWNDAPACQSYLEEYNSHMLHILTIHEAYPGHYVQLEYSNRNPSLIRKVLSSGVFAEGWAVYTEQMMLDQGYGKGDLALRLNQLKFYLRAVANAILDHKMHCTQMTDEEALTFLTQRCFQSEGEALGKIIRAKQSSTAAFDVLRRPDGVLSAAAAGGARAGRQVRPGPLSRGGAGPRDAAGEVSAGAGARTAEATAMTPARSASEGE